MFRETINDYQYGVVSSGRRESFDEVHGYGFPRSRRNRELLKGAVWFVSLRFRSHTSRARLAVVLDVFAHIRPRIFLSNEFQGLVLAWVSAEYVVVLVSEYAESKVVFFWYVDAAIESC